MLMTNKELKKLLDEVTKEIKSDNQIALTINQMLVKTFYTTIEKYEERNAKCQK